MSPNPTQTRHPGKTLAISLVFYVCHWYFMCVHDVRSGPVSEARSIGTRTPQPRPKGPS
jgi:hypothetical protein